MPYLTGAQAAIAALHAHDVQWLSTLNRETTRELDLASCSLGL